MANDPDALFAMPTEALGIGSESVPVEALATHHAFTRAVEPLVPALYRFCRTLSDNAAAAEDLLQNALLKAYLHRASYRGEGPLLSWLFRIVRNEHTELVRTSARRRGLVQSALEQFGVLLDDWMGSEEPDAQSSLEIAQDTESVLRALRSLPESYATVVYMCDVEELSYEAVSEALDLPIGTVKSRHSRGRAKLRELLVRRASDGGTP